LNGVSVRMGVRMGVRMSVRMSADGRANDDP
jgi:hypothetical protein